MQSGELQYYDDMTKRWPTTSAYSRKSALADEFSYAASWTAEKTRNLFRRCLRAFNLQQIQIIPAEYCNTEWSSHRKE